MLLIKFKFAALAGSWLGLLLAVLAHQGVLSQVLQSSFFIRDELVYTFSDQDLQNIGGEVNLGLGLFKLVVEPLGLRFYHFPSQERHQFLLSDLGEELLVEVASEDELLARQGPRASDCPPEQLKNLKRANLRRA